MLESNLSKIHFQDPTQTQHEWDTETHRKSAVAIILVLEGKKEPSILLTRRSIHVNSHKGQIGFAGGRFEPQDQSPLETATREAEEELGVPREQFQFHGYHRPIHDLNKNSIYPVVLSISSENMQLKPNPYEVKEAFSIPITHFSAIKAHKFKFNYFGVWRQSVVFKTPNYKVWGLTAQMLLNLNLS